MEDLSITLVQSDIQWEDKRANFQAFEDKINGLSDPTDVIILPEMFTTGFTNNTALAEMMGMQTCAWMQRMADKSQALVIGSFVAQVHDRYYNRIVWMEPGGQCKTYDKRHLFSVLGEHQHYSAGESLLIGRWRGWKICPLVCYDLRFPVWSRNIWNAMSKRLSYDLLIYIANWPMVRINAWQTLIKARAIENLSYAVGVNRVGLDGLHVEYNGQSAVVGPRGDQIAYMDDIEGVKSVTLSAQALLAFREKFPAYLDADEFTIEAEAYP